MGVHRLFPREGKIFQGAKTLYLPKTPKNIIFSSKKSQRTCYFVRPGGGGSRAPSHPLLMPTRLNIF